MSLELDWTSLSPLLAKTLTDQLNRILPSVPLPTFLDPIIIQSVEFGDSSPEIQIIDIRDISKAFSDADIRAQSSRSQQNYNESASPSPADRYPPDSDSRFLGSRPSPSIATSFNANRSHQAVETPRDHAAFLTPTNSNFSDWRNTQQSSRAHEPRLPSPQTRSSSSQPSLELHLRVTYSGNMRIDLSTALVLNHPAPLFMSLPVKMRVMGFVCAAEVILAIEADRSRCHCTIMEPTANSEEEVDDGLHPSELTPGARILPEMLIHTEVGNADKHVLRNVGKVERFLLDTLRRIICDELLFPYFQLIRHCFAI
ncbi:uncharacterized protein MELLADRAFT_91055 [Melampsora larici-populina 98AG31]|uniref:Mitochondrial distribution and morphology protein 12 n=1 Tax=Melampsora larici-populina (strain 98AG31 / pathotype 3-4-7) TaxID=747676 RepID=F4R8I6_MELLP|nr:uncharacterized protein MELLADRAFT_91055 [Melampsora larici-populina 98AG31]EGG11594.1 hypothetical protein MELLADRAFT_91055 [Melampsora larici-populina 98AG31]